MENRKISDAKSQPHDRFENAETQGDWQLAENDAEETTGFFTPRELEHDDERIHASANPDDDELEEEDDDDDNDDDDDADEPRDWGHTDPLDSPLPDSNDPSGPGSAV